ncbi:MAG: flagellar FlbD family protein [Clostridia bacterium]|jgi:flagellar protein FlbD|nr:flagellar FlbD family protein [Clostridia bacterium]
MIEVTRLNDKTLIINAELVETIEATPNTIITTTTGKKIIVKEMVEEVVDLVIKYKRKITSI